MPELPEVETTRRGIAPHVQGKAITGLTVRNPAMRYPVPAGISRNATGQRVRGVARRAKYLLLELERGTLIIHLGMSGSLRMVPCKTAPEKHDHVDIAFEDHMCLRLRDPRRFGCVLWTDQPPQEHPLLAGLGPEPLDAAFTGTYLWTQSRGRRVAVKSFIMDSRVVVGVGNIYASEALFRAGIHPNRPAGRVSRERYQRLAEAIKAVLSEAIQQGGTTLRDFTASDGRPGYFSQQLAVYGRSGEPCPRCGAPIQHKVIGQRSSYYCKNCQT